MQKLFDQETGKYRVLPLDRTFARAVELRPSTTVAADYAKKIQPGVVLGILLAGSESDTKDFFEVRCVQHE
jgi:hypothetical protein